MMEKRARSIYPPVWAVRIIGEDARSINEALEGYAFQLSRAIQANEKLLQPEEWETLARLDVRLPTQGQADGKVLAEAIQGQGMVHTLDLSGIIERVRPLDWLHARAVVAVLGWARKRPDRYVMGEWWTLAFRNSREE